MSLRSGSLKSPLLVGIVFCVGMGLGVGWKLGWIPVDYAAPPAGTLEETDQTAAEDYVTETSDGPLADADDEVEPGWVADQAEPPVQEGVNRRVAEVDEPAILPVRSDEDVPIIRSARPPATSQGSKLEMPSRRVKPAHYESETETTSTDSQPREALEEPVEEASPASTGRFAEVDDKLAAGELLAAHKLLSKLYWSSAGSDDELQTRLDDTAKKIFFAPQPHFIEPYVVQTGDQLRKIAGKYHLSWEYLSKLNKTDPRRIREGQKLKVLKGPFAAIVNLRDFSLTVHLQGYYVKRYQVGIGKDGSSPIGKFPVLEKIEDPQYTDPDGKVIAGGDPTNPLGKRWIGIGDSYGIHGTIEPNSIGKAESRGCIRLQDADIIEVYNFLVVDSLVEIRE